MNIHFWILAVLFALALSAGVLAEPNIYTPIYNGFELKPHRERPECVVYENHYTPMNHPEMETWHSPRGPVEFKFFRQAGDIPDKAMVWDLPEGVAVLPFVMELEEEETGVFCLVEFKGM